MSIDEETQTISLRGSLATTFWNLSKKPGVQKVEIEDYVRGLAESTDSSLLKIQCHDRLIIGRHKERGMYPPDW